MAVLGNKNDRESNLGYDPVKKEFSFYEFKIKNMKTYWYFFYETLYEGQRLHCGTGYVASDTEFFPLHKALAIPASRSKGRSYHMITNQVQISEDDFRECQQKWRQ